VKCCWLCPTPFIVAKKKRKSGRSVPNFCGELLKSAWRSAGLGLLTGLEGIRKKTRWEPDDRQDSRETMINLRRDRPPLRGRAVVRSAEGDQGILRWATIASGESWFSQFREGGVGKESRKSLRNRGFSNEREGHWPCLGIGTLLFLRRQSFLSKPTFFYKTL